jgi:Domain of unknown function (DUF4153)
MRRLLERWGEARTALVSGFGRFPAAVVALAIFATYVNLAIAELIKTPGDETARAGFALVGAAALATAAVLFGERRAIAALPRHLLSLVLAASVGSALWYWDRLGVAFPALFAAAVASIPLAPYVRREPAGFWAFIWRLIHAAALAFIAIIVFCAGLSAIFASINYLFGVDIKPSLYGHIWSIGLGFVGPLFALSLIPTTFPERDEPDAADIFIAGLRILSDFVAVPLLAVYVVILHVYALKILIESELPKGQIGWMVLTFGLAVLALRVVVYPMAVFAWMPTRLFLRWWPIGLVVPLGLLLIALWQRVSIYGVTPERYALGLFALFLGLVLLTQLSARTRDDVRVVPALAALALFVGSFGPWGMFAVSARSQVDRLADHLIHAGVLGDGKLTGDPQFSRGTAEDVRSIVRMLAEIRQVDRLRPLFAGRPEDPFLGAGDADRRIETGRIWEALNVKELPPRPEDVGDFSIGAGSGAVATDGYDVVVPNLSLTGVRSAEVSLDGGLPNVRLQSKGTLIEIQSGDVDLQITAETLLDAFKERVEAVETLPEDQARPPFLVDLQLGGRRVGLLFQFAAGKLTDLDMTLSGASFDLLLRRADWTPASGGEPSGDAKP